ncbi:MAG: RHS repeat-associated core domain-containing protein [Lachnospiraceae bacterium]|nr:RHS repeat-associated core domain-containing protein [Lachnospiraceae bacterium]
MNDDIGSRTSDGTWSYSWKNAQGDVVAISNFDGYIEVHYSYDAWGRLLGITGESAADIGQLNPLRYRGYVYDDETGLYYLQSRYYDPEIGRFLNADAGVFSNQMLQGLNVFQYCKNNPINMLDSNGFDAIWIQEGNEARGMGHSGLLVQDENEDWFYFYWGPRHAGNSGGNISSAENGMKYINIGKTETDLSDLQNVIDFINTKGAQNEINANSITSAKYFKGDYTNTGKFIANVLSKGCDYSTLFSNCSQMSCFAMAQSDWRFAYLVTKPFAVLVPNVLAAVVESFPAKKGIPSFEMVFLTYSSFLF